MKTIQNIKAALAWIPRVALLAAAAVAHADIEAGYVVVHPVVGSNTVYVGSTTPKSGGLARCWAGSIYGLASLMALDISTDSGKAFYAALLAADASGKQVTYTYTYNSDTSCTLGNIYF